MYKVIAALLFSISIILLFNHQLTISGRAFDGWLLTAIGAGAGVIIGMIVSILGVAGGELLIPTFMLLYGIDIKLAGNLALVVSLPTMLIGFARYSRDQSFAVIHDQRHFIILMAIGSITGAFIGSYLLGIIPSSVLLPLLASILIILAIKIWNHQ